MLNDQQERREKKERARKRRRKGGRNEIALKIKTAIICAPW